jgi:hypothetical protein
VECRKRPATPVPWRWTRSPRSCGSSENSRIVSAMASGS